jgi:phage gp29-like protein
VDGIPLPPHRFIIHEPELIAGQPLSRGLARVVAVAYMAKSYTVKDWLAFAEVYGMPLRVGKYGPAASEDDIQTLITAVANLGTDAAAAIPDSMMIEFVEAAKTSSAEVFSGLADWADKQVSKAVLGQTASADGTPGALGNQEAQDAVRDDLRDADAEELADTLNRDLVASYLALNHGAIDPEAAPQLVIRAAENEDIKALADALAVFIPLGLRVEASVIRDKLGLPEPEDGDDIEVLGQPFKDPEQLPPPPAPGPEPNRLALNQREPDPPYQMTANLAPRAQPLVDAMLANIRRELDQAQSLPAFHERLLTLYPELNSADLTELLAQAFAAGDAAGRLDVAVSDG